MGSFSIWHWIIVLVVVLVLFGGGGKLSKLMGDAGRGMTVSLEITPADDLTLFLGESADRPPSLDTDPRRDPTDPVWDGAASVLVGVLAQEAIDGMTGENVFTFDWTTRTFTKDVGHVIEVTNETGNRFQHAFNAMGMMADSVVRGGIDPDVEVRAPYFTNMTVRPGMTMSLHFVPTVVRDYQTYCQIGVTHADNGAPDLSTGHAGAGMHDLVSVVP